MHGRKPLIAVVESDGAPANSAARLLAGLGYDVVSAGCAADARRITSEYKPDLLVLDMGMPDCGGFTLCVEMQRNTDAAVLFLADKPETRDKLAGLEYGGDMCLVKPYDKNEFTAVIQSLLRRVEHTRKIIAEARAITRGPLTLLLADKKALIDGRDALLTPKEFAVLLLLVQNADKVLPGEAIYKSVWNADMVIDTGLVRKTVSQIKKKLNSHEIKHFSIHTKYGKGYVFNIERDVMNPDSLFGDI